MTTSLYLVKFTQQLGHSTPPSHWHGYQAMLAYQEMRADELASEARLLQHIEGNIEKTATQRYKTMHKVANQQYSEQLQSLALEDPQMAWLHQISDLKPAKSTIMIPKHIQPQINRLRLNMPLKFYDTTNKTIHKATCRHCQEVPSSPTHHLASCPATAILRSQTLIENSMHLTSEPEELAKEILQDAASDPTQLIQFLNKKPYTYSMADQG